MSLIEERLEKEKASSRMQEASVRIPPETLDDLLKHGAERKNGFLHVPSSLSEVYSLPLPDDASLHTGVITYQMSEVRERVLGVDPQYGRVTGSTRVLYELTLIKHNS